MAYRSPVDGLVLGDGSRSAGAAPERRGGKGNSVDVRSTKDCKYIVSLSNTESKLDRANLHLCTWELVVAPGTRMGSRRSTPVESFETGKGQVMFIAVEETTSVLTDSHQEVCIDCKSEGG